MTADEAKQALKEGKKVKPKHWGDKEFLRMVALDSYNHPFEISIFNELDDDEWEIVE